MWAAGVFVQDFSRAAPAASMETRTHTQGEKMQAGCTVLMHFKSRLDQQFLLWAHTSLRLQTHLLKVMGTEMCRWQRDAWAQMPYFVDIRHYRRIFINLLPSCGWFWVTDGTEWFSKQHKTVTTVIKFPEIQLGLLIVCCTLQYVRKQNDGHAALSL